MPKKTKVFIAILIVVIFILIMINFLLGRSPGTSNLTPSPIPTLKPQGDSGIVEKQEEIRTNQYPLLGKTPYKTTLFEVTYTGPLKLKVTMFDEDKEGVKEEVEKWLMENGIKPETHQIEFIKPSLP